MSKLIELSQVCKTYRRGAEQIAAVENVSLVIEQGEFVALTGPSGSGKTTLMHLIGSLEKPDSGMLRIDDQETQTLSESALTALRASSIGFVFQQFFLQPTLTAQENIELPLIFSHKKQSDTASALLEQVGLGHRANHLPAQLSGGEMQRVAIARALVNQPKILLADEPTGSLDSRNAAQIMDIFTRLNRDGLTILMVTHNHELASLAGRMLSMKDGKIRPM